MLVKENDKELVNSVMEVFQTHGYDGVTMTLISDRTGIKSEDLYDRFPGGKEDMAKTVLSFAGEWMQESVIAPLQGPGTPEERLRAMSMELQAFYAPRQKACVLDKLSCGNTTADVKDLIRTAIAGWMDALAQVASEAGVSKELAWTRAQDAVVQFEGALVVARLTQDTGPFERAMNQLPARLLNPPAANL